MRKRPTRHLVVWLSLAGTIAAATAPAAEFFVSPTGRDSDPGTREKPFATFARAQQAARGLAGREPVSVFFSSGTYYLPESVVFTAADGGTTYAALPDEKPVLSGGIKLELTWEPHRDGVVKTQTPAGLAIDQLFVNGQRQLMARYPNYDPNVRPYGGYSADAFSRERAARWADPAGGYIHAMHRAHWGGYHYRITGKSKPGEVVYEGGWQNNRQMGMHPDHRYVENIFEELDAPGEWFHHAKTATLYYSPPVAVDVYTAMVEVVRLRHLVEFRGNQEKPVRNVTLRGFVFRHAARTFMDVKEPLLRSDWTIYRGGAVLFDGAEDCTIADCEFDQMGGNAVFVNNYNRRIAIRGCDIHDTGATALALVGDPKAVRNPLFEYGQRQDYADIDKTPGPQTEDYPADCLVEDCLIRRVGVVEKQATGVQISMSSGITVRHCSIYDASRAGINISEGTFGGHVIEFCDVFDTVRETGDHGSFNSWGRDRYWGLKNAPADELPKLALLDAVKPTTLRNNRWRCDHGWDVDLDDGSSNYEIYNNLFLCGGLKLREGFHRRVWNNIAVHNSLHPHVWYDNSGDVVTKNIWMGAYRPAGGMPKGPWGSQIDHNLFATSDADRTKFAAHGCDVHSLVGDPLFVDPANGDYRVREGSPALQLGFENFPMDCFGVQKSELKALARTPELPDREPLAAVQDPIATRPKIWLGATVRDLAGEEFSAYGVSKESGGIVLKQIPSTSPLNRGGLKAEDLIQAVSGKPVRNIEELRRAVDAAAGEPLTLGFVRAQVSQTVQLADYVYVVSEVSADAQFKTMPIITNAIPIAAITARPDTRNGPLSTLHDGRLAANYGPVFGNDVRQGLYKCDFGQPIAIDEVRTWSFNQNNNRGAQHFILFGSAATSDPGWNISDTKLFTPIAEVTAPCPQGFLATAVRRAGGQPLGTFRWLIWAIQPVTKIGENTALQEVQVIGMHERTTP
jgi:hypothetical protein